MKFLILLIFAIFAQASAESTEVLSDLLKKFEETAEKCMKKHQVSQDQLAPVIHKLQLPIDTNIQCAFACVAKEMDIMNNDNTFNRKKIAIVFEPLIEMVDKQISGEEMLIQKFNELFDICVPLQKSIGDECAAANNGYTCLIENV